MLGQQLVENMAELTGARINGLGLSNATYNQQLLHHGNSIKRLRHADLGRPNRALIIAAGPSIKRQEPAAEPTRSRYRLTACAWQSPMPATPSRLAG